MCTAICEGEGALFGRTLDLECSFGEAAVITPRNFAFHFLNEEDILSHHAIIGIAHVEGGVPLYYDAMNEAGLCIAALNFPRYAVYCKPSTKAHNVASFELIPWLLSKCASVREAKELLENTNITDDNFSEKLKPTPLHFIICDKYGCITVEPLSSGLRIYDNFVGVMTNSPPFDYHITRLSDFMSLGSFAPENNLCPSVDLPHYSRGMGAIGLPGDFSSSSRFIRAVFAKSHATKKASKREQINRFFHIFDTVNIPAGCVKTEKGEDVYTVYTSLADRDTLKYYFTTYGCRKIRQISLRESLLDGDKLSVFDMNAE